MKSPNLISGGKYVNAFNPLARGILRMNAFHHDIFGWQEEFWFIKFVLEQSIKINFFSRSVSLKVPVKNTLPQLLGHRPGDWGS